MFINPELLAAEGEAECEEGCLSVPGYYDKVTRAARIRVRALNEHGETFELDAEGMLAVCIQHEMDHLQGKVFVEYLSPLKRARLAAQAAQEAATRRLTGVPRCASGLPARRSSPLRALAALHASWPHDTAGADAARSAARPRPRNAGLAGQALCARAWRCRVVQPATLELPPRTPALLATPLDVLVVAAYGLILPRAVLAWPRYGCLNIHASLLPRWRGAAPIPRAIEAGDTVTGITIMQMDAGLDTGPIDPAARNRHRSARDRRDAARQAGRRGGPRDRRCRSRDLARGRPPRSDRRNRMRASATRRRSDAPTAGRLDRQRSGDRSPDPRTGAGARSAPRDSQGAEVKLRAAVPVDGPAPEGSAGVVVEAGASGIDVVCGTARDAVCCD